MANTDPELAKAAQLAYERSNASLKDYNPAELADEDKVDDVNLAAPAPSEPILTTADAGIAGTAKSDTSSTSSDSSSTSKSSK